MSLGPTVDDFSVPGVRGLCLVTTRGACVSFLGQWLGVGVPFGLVAVSGQPRRRSPSPRLAPERFG